MTEKKCARLAKIGQMTTQSLKKKKTRFEVLSAKLLLGSLQVRYAVEGSAAGWLSSPHSKLSYKKDCIALRLCSCQNARKVYTNIPYLLQEHWILQIGLLDVGTAHVC